MKHAVLFFVVAVLLGGAAVNAQNKDTVYTAGKDGVTHPVLVTEVKPHYPRAALEAKKGAVVTLDCVVMPDGRPSKVRVQKRGDRIFDREAVKALSQWQFKPGMKDGKPVPVRLEVELTFTAK
jgi:TonB family protein